MALEIEVRILGGEPVNNYAAEGKKEILPPPRSKNTPGYKKIDPLRLMLAPTPCLEAGCHDQAIKEGRCQTHQRPRWQGSNRKSRLPKDWATRRLIVLKRDKGICYLCGQEGADTVDHVLPNDDNSLTNLKAVHDRIEPYCHRYKSSAEGHAAKNGTQIRRRH